MITINPDQARILVEQEGNNSNFIVLDVRTPAEFEINRLPKAINIDIHAHDFTDRINALDRIKTYLVYCKTGGRSTSAAELMEDLGFKDVYNVKGKLFEQH